MSRGRSLATDMNNASRYGVYCCFASAPVSILVYDYFDILSAILHFTSFVTPCGHREGPRSIGVHSWTSELLSNLFRSCLDQKL